MSKIICCFPELNLDENDSANDIELQRFLETNLETKLESLEAPSIQPLTNAQVKIEDEDFSTEEHGIDDDTMSSSSEIQNLSAGPSQMVVDSSVSDGGAKNLNLFSCAYCPTQFQNNSSKVRHETNNHKSDLKNAIYCSYCTYRTMKKQFFQKHLLIHRNFGLSRSLQSTLKMGKKKKKKKLTYTCSQCPAKFRKIHDRMYHEDITHNGNVKFKYSCFLCPMKFTDSANKRRHIRNVHAIQNYPNITQPALKYKCISCSFTTINFHILKNHWQENHCQTHATTPKPQPHHCSFSNCDFNTIYTFDLKRHVLLKHNTKTFDNENFKKIENKIRLQFMENEADTGSERGLEPNDVKPFFSNDSVPHPLLENFDTNTQDCGDMEEQADFIDVKPFSCSNPDTNSQPTSSRDIDVVTVDDVADFVDVELTDDDYEMDFVDVEEIIDPFDSKILLTGDSNKEITDYADDETMVDSGTDQQRKDDSGPGPVTVGMPMVLIPKLKIEMAEENNCFDDEGDPKLIIDDDASQIPEVATTDENDFIGFSDLPDNESLNVSLEGSSHSSDATFNSDIKRKQNLDTLLEYLKSV